MRTSRLTLLLILLLSLTMTGCHNRCLQEKQTILIELEALKTKHTETINFCEQLVGECYQLYIYSEKCSEALKYCKPTI